MTEDNGDYLFVPIAAKWLASGTDDDDNDDIITGNKEKEEQFLKLALRGSHEYEVLATSFS